MDNYNERINKVVNLFKDDPMFKATHVDDSLSEWRVFRKFSKKVIDTTWLEVIEDSLVSLDVIVRNPRRFIVVEEDLIDTSRARSVTEESVKYLAQHTNYIAGFDGDMILPSKLLNSTKEESYEVYENRFIYTLLRRLLAFVRKRYDAVKGATAKNEQIEILVDKKLTLGTAQVTMRLDSIVRMPFEEALKLNSDELGPIERLAKVYNIVSGFMVTPFAKEMVSSEPVRPPIQRTNAILKNNNFKKALALWEFLQSYEEEGYDIRSVTQTEDMSDELKEQYKLLVFLNSVFMQNIANESFNVKTVKPRLRLEDINIDDFPKSDIPVDEVKWIEVPSLYNNFLSDVPKAEINAAIDRCLAQYKINLTNEDSALYEKRMLALRKREQAYKERIIKLRQKERENLAKLERQKERERIREENEKKRLEIEQKRREKREALEAKKAQTINNQLELEQKRLDELAINKVIKETRNEQMHFNRSKLASEIIYFNTLRGKFKAEVNKYVDSQIDDMIKLLQKLYSNSSNDKQ